MNLVSSSGIALGTVVVVSFFPCDAVLDHFLTFEIIVIRRESIRYYEIRIIKTGTEES